jgi:hypothetical protein
MVRWGVLAIFGRNGRSNSQATREYRISSRTVNPSFLGFTGDHWLMMAVDHIIPTHAGKERGIAPDWLEDYWNTVLCCSACREFSELSPLETDLNCPETAEEFLVVRDRIFVEPKRAILLGHEHELAFFDSRPWRV